MGLGLTGKLGCARDSGWDSAWMCGGGGLMVVVVVVVVGGGGWYV